MSVFTALADPTRRRIVELLASGEKPAGEIASAFEMTPQAVSQHLNVLRDAGILSMRAEAQRRLYALDESGLVEASSWIDSVRGKWAARLDKLEAAYQQERAGGKPGAKRRTP